MMFGQLGDLFNFARRQVQRLADLAHGGPEPVSRERAHQSDVVFSVSSVYPANQLFADLPGEIQIDIGDRSHGLVEEPAEEKAIGDRIDVGEAKQVSDDGRDGGATPSTGKEIPMRAAG